MIDPKDLTQFLVDSNKAGYATGEEKQWITEPDRSTTIPFKKGAWRSHDNYFGGEPYGGRVVVFYEEKPVWMMVYYGWVEEQTAPDPVYVILRNALKRMPDESPFRGPKEYAEGEHAYTNSWNGEVDRFSGEEQIMQAGKLVYKANYMGGLVDLRSGL